MIKLFLIIGVIVLSACGSDGGGGATKSLLSTWTSEDNSITLDLTGVTLNQSAPFSFIFASGEICTCGSILTGSMTAGNYALASCTYQSGGSGDPGCAALNSSGTYSQSGVNLTFCDPGCVTYR